MKVETVAQQEFEHAGRSFMNAALTLALDRRPNVMELLSLSKLLSYDWLQDESTYLYR